MALFHGKNSFLKAARTSDASEIAYCLAYYIPSKFSIDVQDEKGMTALGHAAKAGDLTIVKLLLGAGADPNIPSREGIFPLMAALDAKQSQVAQALVTGGANPDTHSPDYVYALGMAAFIGDLDTVKALANAKADLNALIRGNGRTALHWAVEKDFGSIAEFLVQAGARQDIPDKSGSTALDLAKTKPAMMKILRAATAAPAPASVAAPKVTAPAANLAEAAEGWTLAGKSRIAHSGTYPEIGRKVTEIFNFESRERTVISENLKTGAETLTTPESFDNINEEALQKALGEFRRLGGQADDTLVLGSRAPKKAFNL